MDIFKGINAGADFVRADLHIHSFGNKGSYDVTDEDMTPENIVDEAILKGLSVISITDHNEIENVQKALDRAHEKNILVIPGVEISTTQGHLLVYFESYGDLRSFFGKLTISEDKVTCNQGIVDCLDYAEQFNGIGVLAHIELSSGFEQTIGRFNPHMENVIAHRNLCGLEISTKESIDLYTDGDSNSDRKNLIKIRREKLNLPYDHDLPKIMSSDSHTLVRLGTNATGETKLTRIKLDTLSFGSFCIALKNAGSRVRLEEVVPEKIPKFIGLRIQGGLLDQQTIRFSNNLTCIIGGRGTGKSTLLESLKECSGNSSSSTVVDSDVWADDITLVYEDEIGEIHTLSREKNSQVFNHADLIHGITRVPIECYGQGDTASTLQHSDKDPKVLIDFLDSFIELDHLKTEDEEVRSLLLENQSNLNKCRTEVASIPETEKQKIINQNKWTQLRKDKAGELVNQQTALLRERDIRKNIAGDLRELSGRYKDILADNSVFEHFNLLTDEEIIVGREYFGRVKQLINDFSNIVELKSSELNISLANKINELSEQLQNWAAKESEIHKQIEEKKVDLAAKGIPFDIGQINQIAKDALYYEDRLKILKQKEKELKAFAIERIQLLVRRREIKNKIYYYRLGFAKTVNENLKNTVDGFFVTVKYEQGLFSPAFENSIKTLMDWRTARVPKAEYLAKHISPLEFASSIRKGNLRFFKEILDDNGARVFTEGDIDIIHRRTKENYNLEDFETLAYEDRPSIRVTKYVINEKGDAIPNSRSLSQLSLGQQQSILLAILLQSKSNVPLIIDQPEDNLDSEFIYKTIVANLRQIKEKRQVIIVTHNPNIAVLGDAELIIPLKSTNVRSFVTGVGSIDRQETRELCCEILEGGHQAFSRRQEIYGIK